MSSYTYSVNECDFSENGKTKLIEFRELRDQCLNLLSGKDETSIINQVLNLTTHTLTFKTLNEGLRIDPERGVNSSMWNLITEGYANIAMLGVRRLIDKDDRNNSLTNLVCLLRDNAELLTRENFVCFDGLPYDYEKIKNDYYSGLSQSERTKVRWLANSGPESWSTFELMHEQFDKFSLEKTKRSRSDRLEEKHFDELDKQLKQPAIERVRLKVNRQIAHTPNKYQGRKSKQIPKVTFDNIDEAIKNLIQIGNKIGFILCDGSFASAVAIPQFDVLQGLDTSWASKENMFRLSEYWNSCSNEIEAWSSI